MIMKLKCFDIVEEIIEEACKQFSPVWVINKSRVEKLKLCCSLIDNLISNNNSTCYEVEVHDITMQTRITIYFDSLDIEDVLVNQIAEKSLQTCKYQIGERCAIDFTFRSVWDHIS